MTDDKINWKRMQFKKNKVWLATDRDQRPVVKNGRVLIKYQLGQDYEYWVNPKKINPINSVDFETKRSRDKKSAKKPPKKLKTRPKIKAGLPDSTEYKDSICIYTDGASSGNPGPSGIGIVLRFGKHEKEISKYIGIATNNIAELEAIRTGLLAIKNTGLPVCIFTDSRYAYGVLTLGWKARKNQGIIKSIKNILLKFNDLKFIKVKGHAGHEGNERADFLATSAIKKTGGSREGQ
ncbi:MAG: ribonuclease H [Thermodesulfobacteriota bacterium]|nr:ribonuclease H [Thermodesulfobacteriota bacterium]